MRFLVSISCVLFIMQNITAQNDPYQWLETVESTKALSFVKNLNKSTELEITQRPEYTAIFKQNMEMLNDADKIAYPDIKGNWVYNFWRDKNHTRGIWRRCPLEEYTRGQMKWEVLLDIDALAKKDSIKWVFKGANGLYPNYDRFLVALSKGGGDAVVMKEFDVSSKSFIESGFFVPEAKGSANYVDRNTVVLSSDFGAGTMTNSGYPRQVKLWQRDAPLQKARLLYEGAQTDVGVWASMLRDGDKSFIYIQRAIDFFTTEKMLWVNNRLVKLDMPNDATLAGLLKNQLIVQLKSDWSINGQQFKTGTVLSLDLDALTNSQHKIALIVKPDALSSISDMSTTKDYLLVNMLTNVTGNLTRYQYKEGEWVAEKVQVPELGTISLRAAAELSNTYFFTYENFISPPTLYTSDGQSSNIQAVKSLRAYIDATKFEVHQYKAKSADGTMIPYFVISAKGMAYNGQNPTLLYAYGGFEVSEVPSYLGLVKGWLEKGGVYVLANIRGGGEFGPDWHQQGMKANRQRVYDDFSAVSKALITQKITSPKHLGIFGGSNGGLLVGVAFTQHPELYNAVFCAVPLLDMQRYNKLLAGASWMGEYGDPDKPEEWAYIQKYSPYHNLKLGMKYPRVFFYTSTKDDRVHPGHARKMAAKMLDMKYPVYYYENMEGGHAGASTTEQTAKMYAMLFTYMLKQLKG